MSRFVALSAALVAYSVNAQIFSTVCNVIGGTKWCYSNDTINGCGLPCHQVCNSAGFGDNLQNSPDDASWLALQNTDATCSSIAASFGVGYVLTDGALGCIEDTPLLRRNPTQAAGLNGPLRCSTNPACPGNQRTTITLGAVQCNNQDWPSRKAVCPCSVAPSPTQTPTRTTTQTRTPSQTATGTATSSASMSASGTRPATPTATSTPVSVCKVVAGNTWCYNSDPAIGAGGCGLPCDQVCTRAGFLGTLDDATWYNAQRTQPQCQNLANAFGMSGLAVVSTSTLGCAEDTAVVRVGNPALAGSLNGPLRCSDDPICPANQRSTITGGGIWCDNQLASRHALCPCSNVPSSPSATPSPATVAATKPPTTAVATASPIGANACKTVNGVTWCFNGNPTTGCGLPCDHVCVLAGYGNPVNPVPNNIWFSSQNTLAQCSAIASAFGMNGANLGNGTTGCAEDTAVIRAGNQALRDGLNLAGPLQCSTNPACPANQRNDVTGGGIQCDNPTWPSRRAVCPCAYATAAPPTPSTAASASSAPSSAPSVTRTAAPTTAATVSPIPAFTGFQCRNVTNAGVTVEWCFNADPVIGCGMPCNHICVRAGYGLPAISDAVWFNQQNTFAKCNNIATAFGTVAQADLVTTDLGCLEDQPLIRTTAAERTGLVGALKCSTNPACPTRQRFDITDGGYWCDATTWVSRRAVCPCRVVSTVPV